MDEITIVHAGDSMSIDIEDVEPQLLMDTFGLKEKPSSLISVDPRTGNRKIIPISKKNKLEKGRKYHLNVASEPREPEESVVKKARKNDKKTAKYAWSSPELPEIIQNAIICSKAVYYESDLECERYLGSILTDHNLEKIIRSQHGSCHFLIAEELNSNRVYIAFRGTQNSDDWKDNLRAHQTIFPTGRIQGKFHSGFLDRALKFPVDKVLDDDTYKNSEFVICGHSMGGAVATIVAILMTIEVDKRTKAGFRNSQQDVKCVTFGAPLIGDKDLKKFCDEDLDCSRHFFHLVSDGDPVPRLLSYAQSLSAVSSQIDAQVRSLMTTYGTKEGAAFYEEKKRDWIGQKEKYMNLLGKLIPAMEPIFDVVAFAWPPSAGAMAGARVGALILNDVVQATRGTKQRNGQPSNNYVNIGNYLFICINSKNDGASGIPIDFWDDQKILKCFEMSLEDHITNRVQDIPVYHSVENYIKFVRDWGKCGGSFDAFIYHVLLVSGQAVENVVPRYIKIVGDRFVPEITEAELVRVQSPSKDILRLRLTGYNLFNIVLTECQFNFGFPFGQSEDKVLVKRMPMGTNIERVIFEEDFQEMPNISDHGSLIVLCNQFGTCEHLMTKKSMRNLQIPSPHQLSHHDSISVIIKRAIQRGMAVAQLRKNSDLPHWKPANEKIIRDIMKLASITLDKSELDEMHRLFEDSQKSIQFVLSNEAEFQKVQNFCDKIQDYLKKPLHIYLERTVAKKLGIGMATLLGGASLAYLAGPGLVVIGAVEAVSMSMTGFAGAVGGLGAGLLTHGLFNSKMVDENYEKVMHFVTHELFKKHQNALKKKEDDDVEQEKVAPKKKFLQEISDLREDGSIYNVEKALLLMYDQEVGEDNFKDCDLEKCTKASKLEVIKRIECIRTIHNIRGILARQCYIGVVGIQDSGKTTLLHKLWGIGGETGAFRHTDVPMIYELHSKVLVVDFPGSNSLDYHAKTFSICGAMNNLIIVIIPYTGDISQIISTEVSKVFEVMSGSDSSEILLCVNKCGHYLPEVIRTELNGHDDPIDFLRQRFASRLNDYYESQGSNFVVQKERILFTDWIDVEKNPNLEALGICGVDAIKKEIRQYLLSNNIFDHDETAEMDASLQRSELRSSN